MNNKPDSALVDIAFNASGSHTPEPMTWVRMEAALAAVLPELAKSVPCQHNLDKAVEYAERMRRLISGIEDQWLRDQLLSLTTDIKSELGA